MDTILLNGVWKARAETFSCMGESGLVEVLHRPEDWIPAQVPGEIHLDLMRLGQMPDPSVSMNMPGCRWPETKSWWYHTTLELDDEFVRHERQELVFDGLDLYAQVFLNGKLVGEAKNALVPAVFDAKHFLRIGEKVIVRRRGENLVTRLVNDTLRVFQGRVEYGWWRLDGKDREIQAKPVWIDANQMLELYREPITNRRDPRQWLYAAVLYPGQGTELDHSIWLMRPHRELALAYPEIQVTPLEDSWMEVSSPVYCHAVHTEDHGRELIDDNWFDLLPGVAKRLHLSEQARSEDITFSAVTGVPV